MSFKSQECQEDHWCCSWQHNSFCIWRHTWDLLYTLLIIKSILQTTVVQDYLWTRLWVSQTDMLLLTPPTGELCHLLCSPAAQITPEMFPLTELLQIKKKTINQGEDLDLWGSAEVQFNIHSFALVRGSKQTMSSFSTNETFKDSESVCKSVRRSFVQVFTATHIGNAFISTQIDLSNVQHRVAHVLLRSKHPDFCPRAENITVSLMIWFWFRGTMGF